MGGKHQSVQWDKTPVRAVYQQNKNRLRDMHAADVYCYLDCWLSVTIKDAAAAWVKL